MSGDSWGQSTRVQLYIKLAKNANRVNKNLVLPDEYIALEFKGMSGAGAIEVDKNLTFRIRGLNNIHVLDCFVNVALEPADGVVDFGKINSRTIKNTSVSETFRTYPKRNCQIIQYDNF